MLLAELLAGFLVLFIFELDLHMAHNYPLDLLVGLLVIPAEPLLRAALLLDLLCEGRLGVADVELASVGRGMHHELL